MLNLVLSIRGTEVDTLILLRDVHLCGRFGWDKLECGMSPGEAQALELEGVTFTPTNGRVSSLTLVGADFERLPDDITCLVFLEKLELQQCHALQELPDGIGELTHLKKLIILGCPNLKRLPPSIDTLENLMFVFRS
jgi:hypothetical protein